MFSRAYARDAMRKVLCAIEPLGPAAVFGGALRDLSLAPQSCFRSDIDLVVRSEADDGLALCLRGLAESRNRYGGYRIKHGRWMIDVWSLRDTWAFRKGLVARPSFETLVRTTFFNWDAIVYEIQSGALHYLPQYFSWLRSGLLEINLEPNANPAGNVVRALRAVLTRGARLGPKLTAYAADLLLSGSVASAAPEYERFLQEAAVKALVAQLTEHAEGKSNKPFEFTSRQRPIRGVRRATG